MYKKAIRENLTFKSKFGLLIPQQLWNLKMTDLKVMVKDAYKELKENTVTEEDELSFLDSSTTGETQAHAQIKLRYEILKDVYVTRQDEAKQEREAVADKRELQDLEELLQRKKAKKMEEMSEEDLEKLILEKRAKMKK